MKKKMRKKRKRKRAEILLLMKNLKRSVKIRKKLIQKEKEVVIEVSTRKKGVGVARIKEKIHEIHEILIIKNNRKERNKDRSNHKEKS